MKIHPRLLPLLFVFCSFPLSSYVSAQNRFVQRAAQDVSSAELVSNMRSLTGVDPVFLGSGPETLRTRYSYAPGCSLAAEFIAAKLSGSGCSPQFQNYFGGILNSVCAGVDGEVITSGESGRVFYSLSGQGSFSRVPALTSGEFFCSLAASNGTMMAGGYSGDIFVTRDGGNSWIKASTPYGLSVFGLAFDGETNFWACGDNGQVLKSNDGGLTWGISVWVAQPLKDICFVNPMKGWAVGNGGQIVRTMNGGQTWSFQPSGTTDWLLSVDFADTLHGWICGASGAILSTSDGGVNWVLKRIGSTWFNSIDFADSLRGWMVGGPGYIYATSDGGLTWARQASGVDGALNGISFSDSLRGWAAGDGLFLRTVDGGRNWLSAESLLPERWRNIHAEYAGTTNPKRVVLATAHYDSYASDPANAPGADDNSSGTSSVMELARVMKNYHFRNSVRFVLFSGEEQWMRGSKFYVSSLSADDTVIAVINLDMLARGGDSLAIFGHPRDPWLLEACSLVDSLYAPELSIDLRPDSTFIYSDHSSFWNRGYPAILAIEKNFPLNHDIHTSNDTAGNTNPVLHLAATRFVAALVSHLAVPDSALTAVPVVAIARTFSIGHFQNPSRGTLRFNVTIYDAPRAARIILFDLSGRVVRELANGMLSVGENIIGWDGLDERGRRTPSGQYILYASAGDFVESRKVMVVR